MAGFEVTFDGRIWVTPEVGVKADRRQRSRSSRSAVACVRADCHCQTTGLTEGIEGWVRILGSEQLFQQRRRLPSACRS
jgi:hypothetical protein